MIIPIIFSWAVITKNSQLADKGAKLWSVVGLKVLKLLCKIDYQVIGQENIPKYPAIIACKHQSMWETIVMHLLFHRPVYAYKKELRKIPFYGWFVGVMSGICVDRKGGASALKSVVGQAKKYLTQNQSIIIFPQGTRVPVGKTTDIYPYQAGIVAMYLACDVKVIPVALNSGLFWPKNSILKKPGTITIQFLEPIETGMSKKDFALRLQQDIENASEALCANQKY